MDPKWGFPLMGPILFLVWGKLKWGVQIKRNPGITPFLKGALGGHLPGQSTWVFAKKTLNPNILKS